MTVGQVNAILSLLPCCQYFKRYSSSGRYKILLLMKALFTGIAIVFFLNQLNALYCSSSQQRFHSASLLAATSPLQSSSSIVAKGNSRVSILTEIIDEPGSLHEMLRYFWKYEIDLTHIESRPSTTSIGGFHIYIDFNGQIGEEQTDKLIHALKKYCNKMLVIDEKEVPWFPRHISEIDRFSKKTLHAGSELTADHPGFRDPIYRVRRTELANYAINFNYGEDIPFIEYTDVEVKTWGIVYEKLKNLHKSFACDEYIRILPLLEKHCGYGVDRIPQARDISRFLKEQTGFQLRPVAGLLSSRHFLNGLAFKTFFSTQYIRHSSKPLYTPEPDICHELLGHVPMFADQDFADFSQEIGLASLGASDEVIRKLARCYWFSVEFGLLKGKSGDVRAYGAGLLSSFGELEYACCPTGTAPRFLPWNPAVAANTEYPITEYQPLYFVAESLADAKVNMRRFCESLPRPFFARYNSLTDSIWVDRAVRPVLEE